MPNYSKEIASLWAAQKMKAFKESSKWDFNELKHTPQKCRFCGKPMYVCKEVGNFVWWSCRTPDCIGNQDTPRPETSNREFIRDMNRIGDVDKLWSQMRPII